MSCQLNVGESNTKDRGVQANDGGDQNMVSERRGEDMTDQTQRASEESKEERRD